VLTLRGLALAMVNRVRSELTEAGSGPLTILRQMIEERVIAQEARRLGLEVTEAEIDARFAALDREVRLTTNASRVLADVVAKDMKITMAQFRDQLRHQMRKEEVAGHEKYLGKTLPKDEKARLGQVEIVTGEIHKKAKVRYAVAVPMEREPATLPAGTIATVNDEPLATLDFGMELVRRLPSDRVRLVVDQECKAVLTEGMALSEGDMDAEIERERENWNRWREMSREEAWRAISYDDRIRARYGVTLDEVKQDRFFRGYYGLIRSFRDRVSEEEVRREWEEKKETVWGQSIRVDDIQIGFLQKNALVAPRGSRELKDARKLAQEVLVQRETGVPFDQIMRSVNQRQDRSFAAASRRLRNTDDDRLLFDAAMAIKDGEVTLVDTLAAVHVIRREGWVPAPGYDDVRHLIREGIAQRRAEEWLDERLKDPSVVKVRWPLPE
jgi:hypothetical protein